MIKNIKVINKKFFCKHFFQNLNIFLFSIIIIILLNLNNKNKKIKLLNNNIIKKDFIIEKLNENNNKLFSYLNPSKYKVIKYWIEKAKKNKINLKNPKYFYEKNKLVNLL